MKELLTEEILHKKTPEELTTLLYATCIEKLEQAIVEINNKNFYTANLLLQNANDILYRLGAGINYDAGPVSDQLEMLYNYMAEKLVQANLQKDIKGIEEVLTLIKMISAAWSEALQKRTNGPQVNAKNKVSAYDIDYNSNYADVNIKK